jgi:hypothetical protein
VNVNALGMFSIVCTVAIAIAIVSVAVHISDQCHRHRPLMGVISDQLSAIVE